MQKLLLHTCCAPCSIAIIDELKDQYDLTVFFYNPNIHPEEEYLKRKKEVVRVCEEWGVEMIDMEKPPQPAFEARYLPLQGGDHMVNYGQDIWVDNMKGFEQEPEGGVRCSRCFAMRLKKTAQYAAEHEFDIFSTSLTSGRNKKSDVIFPIGRSFADKYDVEFLEEDWKKNGRQEKGKKMIEERGIYRQDYCGCIFSRNT